MMARERRVTGLIVLGVLVSQLVYLPTSIAGYRFSQDDLPVVGWHTERVLYVGVLVSRVSVVAVALLTLVALRCDRSRIRTRRLASALTIGCAVLLAVIEPELFVDAYLYGGSKGVEVPWWWDSYRWYLFELL